jgi:hypothetical protein
MKTPTSIRFAAAVLLALSISTGAAQDKSMADLRKAWLAGNYSDALTLGAQIRIARTNQTAELDYIIGTSACRVGQGDLGRAYLAWCFNYDIADDAKPKIAQSISQCGQQVEPERLLLASAKSGQVGVMWRLKTYSLLPESAVLKSKLPPITKKFSQEELLRRRVAIADPKRATKQALRLAGKNYTAGVSGRFVLITAGESTADFGSTAQKAEKFYHDEYGLSLPASMVTIFLPSSLPALHDLGSALHGFDLPEQCIGYSQQDDLSIVVTPSQGTLLHELFHLMARTSFGDVPPWLDEGMAALYEVSTEDAGVYHGTDSWRAEVLQHPGYPQPTLQRLIAMDWREFSPPSADEQAINEATARYFLFYLQEAGVLPNVFKAFRERQPKDLKIAVAGNVQQALRNDAANTLERTLRQSMTTIEMGFRRWLDGRIKNSGAGSTAERSPSNLRETFNLPKNLTNPNP